MGQQNVMYECPLSLQNGFPDSIVNFKDEIINATIDVYNTAASSLLPTPTKSHYLFNLRDVSRVIGGLVMMRQDAVTDIKSPKVKYVRLWVHEILRVFYDRYVHCSFRACRWPSVMFTTDKGKMEQQPRYPSVLCANGFVWSMGSCCSQLSLGAHRHIFCWF